MVNIVFLHPNVFNVLKYVVFSLTIGCAADIVLYTFMRHNASRTLLNKGRYFPTYSPAPLRISRSNGCHLSLLVTIFIAAALEMALDYSAGATSIWTTSTHTFRISRQVSSVAQLAHGTPDYLVQLRHALQRVEGTCFHLYDRWYSPVSFNMSNSHEFFNVADAALCPQNRSGRVDASSLMAQSSFRSAHVLESGIWNRSELKIGRDTPSEELQVPYDEVGDVDIGAVHKYSFVAANISDDDLIPGSERALTGNTTHESPWALQTARYRTRSGAALECSAAVNWRRDEETGEWLGKEVVLHTCLVPIADNRSVLALYDDVRGDGGERALVMLLALRDVSTFHDLRVLKAMPFLMGRNNRMHTSRELATLAVLCGAMITAFSMDGLEDVALRVDGALVTVPTWSVWGMVLYFAGLAVLIALKVVANRLVRNTRVRGNLLSAKGVAEHWMCQQEQCRGVYGGKGRVALVASAARGAQWTAVGVHRVDHFEEQQPPVAP